MATTFTIYWVGGNKSTIVGNTFDEAFEQAGFTVTSRKYVDMYRYGVDNNFTYDREKKAWIKN